MAKKTKRCKDTGTWFSLAFDRFFEQRAIREERAETLAVKIIVIFWIISWIYLVIMFVGGR